MDFANDRIRKTVRSKSKISNRGVSTIKRLHNGKKTQKELEFINLALFFARTQMFCDLGQISYVFRNGIILEEYSMELLNPDDRERRIQKYQERAAKKLPLFDQN